MSEETIIEEGSETLPEADVKPAPETQDPLESLTPEQQKLFADTNAGLMSALEKERDARKALEKAAKNAEAQRLKDNEDWKTLAEKLQEELAGVKPKAELAETQEETLQALLESQIKELPEDKQSLVPKQLTTLQQFDWLAENRSKLMKPVAPDIGAGEFGGTKDKSVILTPEEKQMAAKMKLTEEEYAKGKT
jgi:hypothetical protein